MNEPHPLRLFLDRAVLGFPRFYLKQFPYLWIACVTLWDRPPTLAGVLLGILLLGLLLLHWQYRAWLRMTQQAYAPRGGKFYIDRPALPVGMTIRNSALLFGLCGLIAYALRDQFNLTLWQIFIMNTGFVLLYQDTLFIGAPVTYIITATGIAIYFTPGHLDYRLFIRFAEISHIERCGFKKDQGWSNIARLRHERDGLLLIPKSPAGFSKRLQRIFIAPRNIAAFIAELPHGFTPLP